jgi:predicted nucleic acid-binding protein
MQEIIIADASCLILLDKIGHLKLLKKLFGTVIITPEVASEFGSGLPFWIKIRTTTDKTLQVFIEKFVDKGEASAITLAKEFRNCLLIIDDLKGRTFAQKAEIAITGTLGIIVEAKFVGIIPAVKPLLLQIKETNFRISRKLEFQILKKAGEN